MNFKIFDVKINFSFYFAFIFIFLIMTSQTELILALFVSLCHELGHILAMYIFKVSIFKINITPCSVDIIHNSPVISYKKEIVILLSGPISNFFLSILFFYMNVFYNQNFLRILYYQNIIIGTINLLPISSLDGGMLFSIFLRKYFSEKVSNQLSFVVSIIFIIPIMCSGFLILIRSNFNVSGVLLSIYLSYLLIFQKWDNKRYNSYLTEK